VGRSWPDSVDASEKTYLAQIVSAQTGLPPADAEKRVDEAYAQAIRAVDKARKASVVAALATATALLLGLAAAWYAAQHGGRHRDNNIPAKFTFLRRSANRPLAGAGLRDRSCVPSFRSIHSASKR
jgi:hypothetical protein